MDTSKFIEQMQDILECETELTVDTKFRELDEWNSLAFLSTIAMIDDEYDVVINANEFKTLETLGDIANAIAEKL